MVHMIHSVTYTSVTAVLVLLIFVEVYGMKIKLFLEALLCPHICMDVPFVKIPL